MKEGIREPAHDGKESMDAAVTLRLSSQRRSDISVSVCVIACCALRTSLPWGGESVRSWTIAERCPGLVIIFVCDRAFEVSSGMGDSLALRGGWLLL